jgi:glycosyltransferase involved in cell wall biosynthesis
MWQIGITNTGVSSVTVSTQQKIAFLANPHSPHVRHWVELLKKNNYCVEIYTIHSSKGLNLVDVNTHQILRGWPAFIPIMMRYICAGIYIRVCSTFAKWPKKFHAHNTSGYGLAALLSGKEYIVTTYGTEIFSIPQRSKLYKKIICRVLHNSSAISTSSDEMTEFLTKNLGVPRKKVVGFCLGISDKFKFSHNEREQGRASLKVSELDRVWIINRRVHPMYRTLESVNGFIKFCSSGGNGKLIVLGGDSDREYLAEIKLLVTPNDQIVLIDKFISQTELRGFLASSDFSISTPITDQLSSSVLESLACQSIPVLSKLKTYSQLFTSCAAIDMETYTTNSFMEMYKLTSSLNDSELKELRKNGATSLRSLTNQALLNHNLTALFNTRV